MLYYLQESYVNKAVPDNGSWEITNADSETASYTLAFGEQGFDCSVRDENWTDEGLLLNDNSGGNVLFLMPQTLGADAKIIMEGVDTFSDTESGYGQRSVTVTASISGGEWKKGDNVIYKISLTDVDVRYVFRVKSDTENLAPFWGRLGMDFDVLSYKIIHKMGQDATYTPVPWRIVAPNGYGTDAVNVEGTSSWTDSFSVMEGTGSYVTSSSGDDTTPPTFGTNANAGEKNQTFGVVAIEPAQPTGEDVGLKPTPAEDHSHAWLANTGRDNGSGKAKAYDLSVRVASENSTDAAVIKSGQNTANCYIVDAPGYFKLPLVYGNAITDGADNTFSYNPGTAVDKTVSARRYRFTSNEADNLTTDVAGTESITFGALVTFLNSNNAAITSPWILNDINPSGDITAEIVWQDQPCLLTELEVDADKQYLYFRVRQDCVCEGNAVVALKAAGKVLWSWHIWVTEGRNVYDVNNSGVVSFNPEDIKTPGELRTAYNRVVVDEAPNGWKGYYLTRKFSMMDVHIGQCDGEAKVYAAREGKVVFQQYEADDVKNTASIVIRQGGDGTYANIETTEMVITPDNAPYYQYGRKDPMLPAYTKDGASVNKTYYLNDRSRIVNDFSTASAGSYGVGVKNERTTIGNAIQNPGVFYGVNTSISGDENILFNPWISDNSYCFNLWSANNDNLPMFSYTYNMNEAGKKHLFFQQFDSLIDLDDNGAFKANSGIAVVKTIYDPCPPGYEMPRIDAFTGFTFDGTNRRNNELEKKYTGVNVEEGTFSNFDGYNAYSFYTEPMPSLEWTYTGENALGKPNTLLIQALGHRSADGSLGQYENYGAALTCSPVCIQWIVHGKNDSPNEFMLQLSRFCYINGSYTFRPFSSSNLCLAFPVMPVKTGMNPHPEYYKLYRDSDLGTVVYD